MKRVQQAVIMAENRLIEPDDLQLPRCRLDELQSLAEARACAEKAAIVSALRACRYNVAAAAERLEVSRATLYRLLERYRLGRVLTVCHG